MDILLKLVFKTMSIRFYLLTFCKSGWILKIFTSHTYSSHFNFTAPSNLTRAPKGHSAKRLATTSYQEKNAFCTIHTIPHVLGETENLDLHIHEKGGGRVSILLLFRSSNVSAVNQLPGYLG